LANILVDMSYSPESRSSRKFEGISAINGLTNENRHNNPLYVLILLIYLFHKLLIYIYHFLQIILQIMELLLII